MAERDRYDWDRDRDYGDREREYRRGGDRERGYEERGVMSRGADEVRSWFGDDDARRRREMDEQRDRQFGRRDREYGPNSEQARREHGWSTQGQRPDSEWDARRGVQQTWGDQRDFIGRGNDWTGSREDRMRDQANWPYSGSYGGNYTPKQTSPGFSGGYGAFGYESGNYRGSNWSERSGYGSRDSGYGEHGDRYERDSDTTGEGRWSGQRSNSAYGGWSSGIGMFAGRGPRNYQRSDERIREDVNERLTADPRIDASDIDVRVQNGEVTLSGTVDDRRARRLAEEIIEDLPGVRDVRLDLRVSQGRWEAERHLRVGEQSHGREDGSIGHTGDPQRRDDVTTVNVKDAGKR